jgi:Flp pilus assembly protein TadG
MPSQRFCPCQRPVPLRTGAGLRRLRTDERGAATAELVLAVPLLLLLIMSIVQFTLWLHATHIAQAAASEALSATRVHDGSVASGQAEADQVLQQLGRGPLRNPTATVTRNLTQASVYVEGSVTAIIPFLTFTATGNAAGPVERFVPGGRP